ncbi:MAG: PHA/PHB synthase family protein [Cellvibrionaceae bacterium]
MENSQSLSASEKIQQDDSRVGSDVDSAQDGSKDQLQIKLERLRNSSLALSRFTQDLRTQYAFDTAETEMLDEAEVLDNHQDSTAIDDSLLASPELKPSRNSQGPKPGAPDHSTSGGLKGVGLAESAGRFFLQSFKQPEVFVNHYSSFAKEVVNIVQSKSKLEPPRKDKRFRDAVWKDNYLYRSVMQTYLAWDKEVTGWVDDLDMEEADKRRSQFLREQVSAMLSPTNSPLNPVAVKRAYQTGGKSVVSGLKNLVEDIHTNHAMPSQVRPDSYTVGKDLAISSGAVVYRSEVLELLQYQMDAGQVIDQRPVLIVPPQINKFYVFDLTPKNSLVKHLQSQGVQPFVISWRNPSRHNAAWNLDRYVSELEAAIEVMCEITGSDQINLSSACAGGVTSMALLGYLQAANKPLVHSHSMFVTALQADDTTSLGLFATREGVELSRKLAKRQGYMDGKSLSHIFNWLRPTDLVWNFWINNYLLGKEPPSMDVLYWDNDSTRLPAGLHSDFLDIFVEDKFVHPDRLVVKGYPLDIRQISMDFYCVGGNEDYLMPWKKCFEVPKLVSSECTMVLSTSGHIQSILRPPGIANTVYYTNESECTDADQWLGSAVKNEGSWWDHWGQWLHQRAGKQQVASGSVGSKAHPPLSPAPGLYVNEKVA